MLSSLKRRIQVACVVIIAVAMALVAGVITLLGYGLFELVFQVRLPTPWI